MKCDAELGRLRFVENRDGKEEAIKFARQTARIYIDSLKTPYGKAFHEKLVESIYSFMEYLRENEQ